jgi:hypothetical protein
MSDGILKDILQLEQKIEADLCREEERAQSWFTEICRAIDSDLSGEQKDNDLATEQQSAETIRSFRQTAAEKLRRERRWAKTLVDMPDGRLLPLLQDQLKVVLTGRDDDCPDDKS